MVVWKWDFLVIFIKPLSVCMSNEYLYRYCSLARVQLLIMYKDKHDKRIIDFLRVVLP